MSKDCADCRRMRGAAKGVRDDWAHFNAEMKDARQKRDSRLRDLVETAFVARIKGSLPVLLLALDAALSPPQATEKQGPHTCHGEDARIDCGACEKPPKAQGDGR